MDKQQIDKRVAALEREVQRLSNVIAAMSSTTGLSAAQIVIMRHLLDRQSNGPVKTIYFAGRLSTSRKTAWLYLSELENLGYVYRPGGKYSKSGWLATGQELPFA
jgi:predicted transcriptional regulator